MNYLFFKVKAKFCCKTEDISHSLFGQLYDNFSTNHIDDLFFLNVKFYCFIENPWRNCARIQFPFVGSLEKSCGAFFIMTENLFLLFLFGIPKSIVFQRKKTVLVKWSYVIYDDYHISDSSDASSSVIVTRIFERLNYNLLHFDSLNVYVAIWDRNTYGKKNSRGMSSNVRICSRRIFASHVIIITALLNSLRYHNLISKRRGGKRRAFS